MHKWTLKISSENGINLQEAKRKHLNWLHTNPTILFLKYLLLMIVKDNEAAE